MMKISVITPSIKYDRLLDLTIDSIVNQTYSNVEHILACYKSTVNTEELPLDLHDVNNLKVSLIKDSFYEGMMKIIHETEGEILCILNPGEVLYDSSTLSRIVNSFQKRNCNLIYGKNMLYNGSNNLSSIFSLRISKNRKWQVPFGDMPLYTAIFIKRELLLKMGILSGKQKFSSEYELYRLLSLQPDVMPYYMDTYAYLRNSNSFRMESGRVGQNLTA
ncbi:glycosyltransferase [Saccharicrinis sp. FJH62]|uniref:glycosyltransferase n=1 Tax=Saccharicrinis sp. FJH62 TaxID=3344657 RepID=UPI0035D52943